MTESEFKENFQATKDKKKANKKNKNKKVDSLDNKKKGPCGLYHTPAPSGVLIGTRNRSFKQEH